MGMDISNFPFYVCLILLFQLLIPSVEGERVRNMRSDCETVMDTYVDCFLYFLNHVRLNDPERVAFQEDLAIMVQSNGVMKHSSPLGERMGNMRCTYCTCTCIVGQKYIRTDTGTSVAGYEN